MLITFPSARLHVRESTRALVSKNGAREPSFRTICPSYILSFLPSSLFSLFAKRGSPGLLVFFNHATSLKKSTGVPRVPQKEDN